MPNSWDMDIEPTEPERCGITCYTSITVTILTEHPNERELTEEGMAYAYNWLRFRISAQIGITLPQARLVIRCLDFDAIRITGADDRDAKTIRSYAAAVLCESLLEWAAEVEKTGGVLPNGQPMFREGLTA